MKSPVWTLLITIAGIAACSVPNGIRGNILQPTDRELPAYADQLVIFEVRVATEEGALKLWDVDLRDTKTGSPWRFPLFANSLMKTSKVPFEEKDGAIHHAVVLDLPPGTYEILSLEFRDYNVNLAGNNVSQRFIHEPPAPLFLTVVKTPQPQYLGMLDIAIDPFVRSQSDSDGFLSDALSSAAAARASDRARNPAVIDQIDPGGTDAMLGAAAVASATDFQTLGGSLAINVLPPDPSSAKAAGQRFRALSGMTVVPGKMWVAKVGHSSGPP